MSKEKTQEDKLREAAKNFKWDIYKPLFGNLIAFAKSKEAAEYHQSLQPVVDVKKLSMNIVNQILDLAETSVEKRQSINDQCDNFVVKLIENILPSLKPVDSEELKHQFEAACVAIGPITKDRIWKLFLPYLQPPAPESDAVDFADWLKENKYKRGDDWYYGVGRDKTTSQLYTEYKQSKTNSDEHKK